MQALGIVYDVFDSCKLSISVALDNISQVLVADTIRVKSTVETRARTEVTIWWSLSALQSVVSRGGTVK